MHPVTTLHPAPAHLNGPVRVIAEPVVLDPPTGSDRTLASRGYAFTPGESIAALAAIGFLIYVAVRAF